jgi:internalin A
MLALMLIAACAVPGDRKVDKEELRQEQEAADLLASWKVTLKKDDAGRVVAVDYGSYNRKGVRPFDNLDEICEPLRHLKRLRKLRLSNMRISAVGLANIKELTTLEHVNLDTCFDLDDEAIRCLSGLHNLRELIVFNARKSSNVTSAGVAHLKKLTKLQRLELINVKGTGHDLSTFTNLRYLSLSGTTFADEDMRALTALTGLEELNVSDTVITDDGMKHLAGLKKLHTLRLNDLPITDGGMKPLHGLTALRHVEIYHTKVSKEAVMALEKALPDLTRRIYSSPQP